MLVETAGGRGDRVWMIAPASMAAQAASLRCGWLDNPSPGNASLYDKDGEWTIAVQGGHQANGDWPPDVQAGTVDQARGSGDYGYGCVCLTVDVDVREKNILNISSANGAPTLRLPHGSRCREY